MQDDLLELWNGTRSTILFVTHSIEEAVIVGSRILVLTPHPGQVRAELNAHQFAYADQGSGEFGTLCGRIHQMLFTPCPRHPKG
jgi:NitT/TauT family transport system ATP-binding protein